MKKQKKAVEPEEVKEEKDSDPKEVVQEEKHATIGLHLPALQDDPVQEAPPKKLQPAATLNIGKSLHASIKSPVTASPNTNTNAAPAKLMAASPVAVVKNDSISQTSSKAQELDLLIQKQKELEKEHQIEIEKGKMKEKELELKLEKDRVRELEEKIKLQDMKEKDMSARLVKTASSTVPAVVPKPSVAPVQSELMKKKDVEVAKEQKKPQEAPSKPGSRPGAESNILPILPQDIDFLEDPSQQNHLKGFIDNEITWKMQDVVTGEVTKLFSMWAGSREEDRKKRRANQQQQISSYMQQIEGIEKQMIQQSSQQMNQMQQQ